MGSWYYQYTKNTYPHCDSHHMHTHVAWPCVCVVDVNSAYCLTSHVIAVALQALKALPASLIPSPHQAFCHMQCVGLWYQDVDCTHCLTPHVAAVALPALKAPHTCILISQVENLRQSSWLVKHE